MARRKDSDYSGQAEKNKQNLMRDAVVAVRKYTDDHGMSIRDAIKNVTFDFRLTEEQSTNLGHRFGI